MKERFNCDKMSERNMAWKVLKVIGMVILGIGIAILMGFVIMWLWNGLMPDIFKLGEITYWQAVGLFILAKLFFGGFSGGSHDSESKGKGGIKHEIGKEIKKEFDKEFDKDYAKEQRQDIQSDDVQTDDDYDKAYERWWSESGEENFQKFMDDKDEE